MYTCIITGGPDISPDAALIASSCDVIYCADSGADYALENGILGEVDKIFGDLDSLSSECKSLAETNSIEIAKYPVEKDMTDTELILSEIIDSDMRENEIVLITSMGGRMDHFIANNNLLIKYHKLGLKVTATDGVTDIIPFCGEESLSFELPDEFEKLNVSLIPMEECSGVSSEGLYYPLSDATLHMGDTLSVSNHPVENKISVSQKSGAMLLVLSF